MCRDTSIASLYRGILSFFVGLIVQKYQLVERAKISFSVFPLHLDTGLLGDRWITKGLDGFFSLSSASPCRAFVGVGDVEFSSAVLFLARVVAGVIYTPTSIPPSFILSGRFGIGGISSIGLSGSYSRKMSDHTHVAATLIGDFDARVSSFVQVIKRFPLQAYAGEKIEKTIGYGEGVILGSSKFLH